MSKTVEVELLLAIVLGELRERHRLFKLEVRRINETCAADGIVGGPLIEAVFNASVAEADARLRLICNTIKQNVLDTTYDVDELDLLAVFDSSLPIDHDLITGLRDALRASGIPGGDGFAEALTAEVEAKAKRARAELGFFAAAPRRADTQSVLVHGDVGHIQAGGTSNVNQDISRSSDTGHRNGAIAQVRGLLDVVEKRLDESLARDASLTKAVVAALDPIFKIAYGVDVSTAAHETNMDVGDLYAHLHNIQVKCVELAQIHDEYLEFAALERRGNYYQTGPERRQNFIVRRDSNVQAIKCDISAARRLLDEKCVQSVTSTVV